MMGFERSDDYQPLFWVRGRPVHVTSLLVILHVGGLLLCALFQGFLPQLLELNTELVLRHWALWRPVTYAFAHVLRGLSDSLWFLLEMLLLFVWGREVERYFGRKVFISLYVAMLLAASLVLLGTSALVHRDIPYAGSEILHFGVFLAFVAVYPGVEFFAGIPAKWIALAILVIWTAALLTSASYLVPVLWATSLVAYFGARYASVGGEAFEMLGSLRPRLPRKTVPSGVKPRMKPRRAVDSDGGGSDDSRGRDVHESIDPLLDKISKHGLASLTNSERAVLEKARVSLLRKDRRD